MENTNFYNTPKFTHKAKSNPTKKGRHLATFFSN
jgi:hypothetical protein